MHPKSKLHYIECFCHRHWHMSGPYYISSRRIYKKIKAIASLFLIWPHRGSNNPGGLSNSTTLNIWVIPVVAITRAAVLSPTIKSTNQNTASQRLVEKPHVGGSSERAKQDEKKPEFRFKIRPIRTKLRAENAENSLRRRIIADIFQTAHH